MDLKKPLRIVLFSYDLLRLLFLAVSFTLFPFIQSTIEAGVFPYLVYLSANALFPMISFFIFIKPVEYRNYLPLYVAGKTISVILFFVWAVISLPFNPDSLQSGYFIWIFVFLNGIFFICFADVISIFGIWMINKKSSGTALFSFKEDAQSGINGGQ